MASYIGKPLFLDNAVVLGERLAFARCFVEISASEPLLEVVVLEMQDKTMVKFPVEYDWTQSRFWNCCFFGHLNSQYHATPKWGPKKKVSGDSHEEETRNLHGNVEEIPAANKGKKVMAVKKTTQNSNMEKIHVEEVVPRIRRAQLSSWKECPKLQSY